MIKAMVRAMVYAGLPHNQQVKARFNFVDSKASDIINAVCRATGITQSDMTGKRRTRDLVEARHIAFALLRELTLMSYPQIGKMFGRDHATVIYGVRTYNELFEVDNNFRSKAIRARRAL